MKSYGAPKSILILGAYGNLGHGLSGYLGEYGYKIFRHGRGLTPEVTESDIAGENLQKFICMNKIDVIINLVASIDVDKCEIDPKYAFSGNVDFVANLVKTLLIMRGNDVPHLIHISTDHLYDGLDGESSEKDVRLLNSYAVSKYYGELYAQKISSTILRTNFLGKSNKSNYISLSDWIVDRLKNNDDINIFNNITFSPVHISTLCKVICHCIENNQPGIFNVGSKDGMSKANFALSLARILGFDAKFLHPVEYQCLGDKAPRPFNMLMNSHRFERCFGYELPVMKSEIELLARDYLI
jgi:dTDP-4-dehydrorhamnose reductase